MNNCEAVPMQSMINTGYSENTAGSEFSATGGITGQMMSSKESFRVQQGRSDVPSAISIYSDESRMPETLTNTAYIPAYLRHQIGRWMRIEFLVGNIIEEKVGQLLDVGASFLILKMLEPSTTMLCDMYSIKFITIIYDSNLERLYTR